MPDASPGLRELHKARTRAALVASTRRLVQEHGYDNVVVRDICTDAGVSPRSFYRYFTGKPDAVLGVFADYLAVFVSLVAARPATEHPMDSLIAATEESGVVTLQALSAGELAAQLVEGFDLVETVPEVGGRFNWLASHSQDQVTDLLAARMHARADDPRPRLYAAASTAAFHAATRSWYRLPASKRRASRVFEMGREALEAFAAGLRDY